MMFRFISKIVKGIFIVSLYIGQYLQAILKLNSNHG